jgi:hypothetical protein
MQSVWSSTKVYRTMVMLPSLSAAPPAQAMFPLRIESTILSVPRFTIAPPVASGLASPPTKLRFRTSTETPALTVRI